LQAALAEVKAAVPAASPPDLPGAWNDGDRLPTTAQGITAALSGPVTPRRVRSLVQFRVLCEGQRQVPGPRDRAVW